MEFLDRFGNFTKNVQSTFEPLMQYHVSCWQQNKRFFMPEQNMD